ncbi:unnamed protein product [Didymodactylos carnosus]|uniref:Apoptosis inhibitor 5 n=1 Tax=Didymodactylos carnosus TaxID=1234261 RepID=A0A814G0L3_9BILA|nr:unnamed protein product [Didymodactylos carnosus]CAF0991935.1 unnamed protein product [Didymodactylos carnosus]CAF3709494.1 unnamed protein product [Didymodactylos carnosus]CAF3763864.1 unnamed protein product [Didymodactylos carnosus]
MALEAFSKLIEAIKAGPKEKRLALQFIGRFCKNFPTEMTKALEAIFDLCEDEDVTIRKQAVKELPTLVRASPETLPRVVSILIQLLQANDTTEITQVQGSLLAVYYLNQIETVSEILNEIQRSQEDLLRKRALRFLCTRIGVLDESDLSKDVEEHIIKKCKEIANDLDPEEFITVIKLLSTLKSMQTLLARQELVNMITAQCHLEEGWNGEDTDRIATVAAFMNHAISLLSKNVHSTKFVTFMLDYVVENIPKLPLSSDDKLDLFRVLAEMCPYCGEFENVKQRLGKLFDVLLTFLPKPQAESVEESTSTNNETPVFEFSFIECLMYSLHQLSRKYPDFLIAEENEEKVKDFRLRLRYFYRGLSNYTNQLKAAIDIKSNTDDQDEQKKSRLIAYKICSNNQALLRDLCRSPPSFKTTVTLSWKPIEELKRSISESDGANGNSKDNASNKRVSRPEQAVYKPPGGKFSNDASNNRSTYTTTKNRRGYYQRY